MGLSICWDREAPCAGVQLLGCTIQLLGMDPGCSDRAQVPTGTTLPHSFRHSIGFPQHTESEEPFPPPQPPDVLPCSQVTLGYRHCQRDLPADGSSHRCISFCSLRVSPPAPSCCKSRLRLGCKWSAKVLLVPPGVLGQSPPCNANHSPSRHTVTRQSLRI